MSTPNLFDFDEPVRGIPRTESRDPDAPKRVPPSKAFVDYYREDGAMHIAAFGDGGEVLFATAVEPQEARRFAEWWLGELGYVGLPVVEVMRLHSWHRRHKLEDTSYDGKRFTHSPPKLSTNVKGQRMRVRL